MRNHRQYRTKIVRQIRRQIFRQMKQKAEWILDVFTSIFVKYDGKFASRWRAKSTDALCAVLPIIIYTGDFPLFCPIRRYFLLGDKNSIQYHVADSHAAAFSTGSLSLRYTALLLPMISYDICFYFRMERILWLLPIARLSNHFRNDTHRISKIAGIKFTLQIYKLHDNPAIQEIFFLLQ